MNSEIKQMLRDLSQQSAEWGELKSAIAISAIVNSFDPIPFEAQKTAEALYRKSLEARDLNGS